MYITWLSSLPEAPRALQNWNLLLQLIVWQIGLVIQLNAFFFPTDYFYNIFKTQTLNLFKHTFLLHCWLVECLYAKSIPTKRTLFTPTVWICTEWKKKKVYFLNRQWFKTLQWGPSIAIIFHEYYELSIRSCHAIAGKLLKGKTVRTNSEVNIKD